MLIAEQSIIPYNVDLTKMRRDMQTGEYYQDLPHLTRAEMETYPGIYKKDIPQNPSKAAWQQAQEDPIVGQPYFGGEGGMRASKFNYDLLLDIDVNVTSLCEEYPKCTEDEIMEKIRNYVSKVKQRYGSMLLESFWRSLYNACSKEGCTFVSNHGNKDYAVFEGKFYINPLKLYELFGSTHKVIAYEGPLNS